MERLIKPYGNNFTDFYAALDKGVQNKFVYVFKLIQSLEIIPNRFFKHVEGSDGLFEIRVEFESNIYRVFCFFDDGNVIILINSFQKKSQKTPVRELALAKKLKLQYFIDKKIDFENESRKKIKK
ncbi:MAG: type II toxin-antitoxin system RelE/ParE family toxin [Taibaiella sp.]|nr:type II toxin-antitoxin system RelE/ParE family toxin [Taibaiella sp.]